MKKNLSAAIVLASLIVAPSALAQLTFSSFVTDPSLNGAPIGFSYAGNKFVGSLYFNNQLYQTDLSGGNVQNFGAPLPIASAAIGEVYVTSSLGLGGFGSRQVFAGSEAAGTVYRFNNDGTGLTSFVSGLAGDVRGIGFDPYGLYGYDMIVTTQSGNVYRVNSAGTPTLLVNVGGDAEGLDFAPNAFGSYAAGTLFVLSEYTGRINAISPLGVKSDIGLQFSTPEMLSFVPTNLGSSGNPLEGFYAANYTTDVIKAGASEFTPYLGQAILTEEGTHNVYRIYSDNTGFHKQQIGNFPAQPEDGVFVTARILNPVPDTGCFSAFGLTLLALAWLKRRESR